MVGGIEAPQEFEWSEWISRWEAMQARYLPGRAERFAVMIAVIRATLPAVQRIVDLGCGPGSLMRHVLEAFPQAQVTGIDLDPRLLLLGKAQLAEFGDRAQLILDDLREPRWSAQVLTPADAVVSATALHWLAPDRLAALYDQVARVLRPGGIFLNADHVGSDFPPIQAMWGRQREAARAQGATPADDWTSFWQAYNARLGISAQAAPRGMQGGVEAGLPLAWQFHSLKTSGFQAVDCFWRSDGDAVYGGVRSAAAG